MKSLALGLVLGLGLIGPAAALPAHAGPGDVNPDSVYLVGEFVDPVCIFQHGMQGALQRQCAVVRGAVDQGMLSAATTTSQRQRPGGAARHAKSSAATSAIAACCVAPRSAASFASPWAGKTGWTLNSVSLCAHSVGQ